MLTDDQYRRAGGKPLMMGDVEAWAFGWVPPDHRSNDQMAVAAAIENAMQPFAIVGRTDESKARVSLFDLWKHPKTVAALGWAYPGVRQISGSCVGASGGDAIFSLSAAEVIRLADPEKIVVPFWLLPYGRSRYHGGLPGRGEGSFGQSWAKAVMEDGVLPATLDGLPSFERNDGLVWGSNVEFDWSDGAAAPSSLLEQARKHPVKSAARIRNADEFEQAIRNYYPTTFASSFGYNASVEDGVLLGRRGPRWLHQMSGHAVMIHQRLGRLFGTKNQWGDMFGHDPAGLPPGSVWLLEADIDWICRNGEVYAYSQFNGFPAQSFEWSY